MVSGSVLPGVLAYGFGMGALLAALSSPGLVAGIVIAFILIIALNGIFVAGETAIDLLKASHGKAVESEGEQRQADLKDMLARKPSFVAACSLGAMTMRAWMVGLTVVRPDSLSEKLDTTSAAGKMMFRMLAVLSEFERDLVSERTRAALHHLS